MQSKELSDVLTLARMHVQAGHQADAEAVFADLTQTLPKGTPGNLRCEVLLERAGNLRKMEQPLREAEVLVEAMLLAPDAETNPEGRAKVAVALAYCLVHLGQPDQALEHASTAWKCLPGIRDCELRVRVLNAFALAQTQVGLHDSAMRHYRQVLRETRRSAALIRERQRALINIGVSCNKRANEMDADDPRRPALWRREARVCRAAESTRPELTYSLIAGLNRVGALLNLARLNEARAELERLAPDARAAGLAEFDGHFLAARARLAKAMGEPMQGASLLESAIDTLGRLGTNETVPGLLEELSDIHEQVGRHDLALVALRESVRRRREVERASSRQRTLVLEALHRVRVMQVALAEAKVQAASNAAQLSKVQTEAERLLAAAHTDPLTGLGNRRALEVMADSLDRTAMGGYGVVMADLDHFKRINDRFSHAVGDAVLRQVAVLLRDCCRATDGVFRMGGEELVMVLPRCTLSKAVAHGERVRAAIERHAWSSLAPGLAVTASLGVAEAAEGESFQCALARAVYHAKHAGRNRAISLPAADPDAGIDGFEGEEPIGTRTH